jgi:hypothetical protein
MKPWTGIGSVGGKMPTPEYPEKERSDQPCQVSTSQPSPPSSVDVFSLGSL